MAANPHDDKQDVRKRSRETSAIETFRVKEPSEKRRKEASTAIPKVEISCYTYFSLPEQAIISEEQLKVWGNFIRIIRKFLFQEDIYVDDSTPYVIYVPAKILTILQKINYNKISLSDLSTILEDRHKNFIEALTALKRSMKKSEEEREKLFAELKDIIQQGILNLTLTEPGDWNVIHITIFFNRIDLLICIQQYLLPELLEQYDKLLCAKTRNTQSTPISMMEARYNATYYKEMSSLLNEKSLQILKEKQLIVILNMLVSHERKLQCASLCEPLKLLVAEGVDPTKTEEANDFTILHYAVDSFDKDLVEYILQHISLKQCQELLSAKTKDLSLTPMSMANTYNYANIFLLLKEKKDLIEIFSGLRNLKKISETEKDRALLDKKIEQFIINGGDPTLTDDRGLNFLHYAACFDDIKLISLIKKNVTPQQYKELLCTKSRKLKETPYEVVQNHKKKSPERESMLKLLNPEPNQNISQSLEPLGGQSAFFRPTMNLSSPNKTISSATNPFCNKKK